MPLPEGYLPRKGDVLVLHGTVSFDFDTDDLDPKEGSRIYVRLSGDHSDRRVPLVSVVELYARRWNEDELVITPSGIGTVIGFHDGWVWVKQNDTGEPGTWDSRILLSVPTAKPAIPPAPPGEPRTEDAPDEEIAV